MGLSTDSVMLRPAYAHVKRLFTVAEANRSLVLVERIVHDIVLEYVRALDIQEAMEAAHTRRDCDSNELHEQLLQAVSVLQDCIDELECVGAELRDWAAGIVDFPSMSGGREICLCWKYGEKQVAHWHEADGGCAGRQSLGTIGKAQPVTV